MVPHDWSNLQVYLYLQVYQLGSLSDGLNNFAPKNRSPTAKRLRMFTNHSSQGASIQPFLRHPPLDPG